MSEVAHKNMHHTTYSQYETGAEVTGWVGWVGFAGFMMILSGIFQAIAGMVAIFREAFFVVNSQQVLIVDVRTWGWVNLLVGLIVVLAGLSLFGGSTWSRVMAVIFAMGAAIVNMVSLPLYPVWSLICITLSVLVMYAVIAHGGELKQ